MTGVHVGARRVLMRRTAMRATAPEGGTSTAATRVAGVGGMRIADAGATRASYAKMVSGWAVEAALGVA